LIFPLGYDPKIYLTVTGDCHNLYGWNLIENRCSCEKSRSIAPSRNDMHGFIHVILVCLCYFFERASNIMQTSLLIYSLKISLVRNSFIEIPHFVLRCSLFGTSLWRRHFYISLIIPVVCELNIFLIKPGLSMLIRYSLSEVFKQITFNLYLRQFQGLQYLWNYGFLSLYKFHFSSHSSRGDNLIDLTCNVFNVVW